MPPNNEFGGRTEETMSQVHRPKVIPRWGRRRLACAALVCAGFGFVLGRSSADGNPEIVQTGEIHPLARGAEIEVRYPRPYASLPCLRVDEPIISYEMVQQTAQGFRIRVKNFYANFDKAEYTAKGVPVSR